MNKRLILIATAVGVASFLLGCGVVSIASTLGDGKSNSDSAKSTPVPTQSEKSSPLEGDPSKLDTSASVAEDYPQRGPISEDVTLPEGSLEPAFDGAYPAATNQLELTFFEQTIKSCDLIQAKGAKFYLGGGTYRLVAYSKEQSGFVSNLFDSSGQWISTTYPGVWEPAVCQPRFVNEQVAVGNELYASHFWLESLNGEEFIWHSHNGSAEVSTVMMYFTDKRVSTYSEGGTGDFVSWIRYGLNAEELKSAAHQY